MRVEVWLDFVCPFSYIGKRRLEMASQGVSFEKEIEVVYHSFELDPHATATHESASDVYAQLAQTYRISLDEAKALNDEVVQQAQELGLEYHFESMIPANTFNAHRVAHFAKEHGKGNEITERFFQAYFMESQDLSNFETLARLAAEVGLSADGAMEVLQGDKYLYAVRRDEKTGTGMGLKGLPFFIINHKYSIAGAESVDMYRTALEQVYKEENARARK